VQVADDGKRVSLYERREVETFEFNRVFSAHSTQEEVFEAVMAEQVEYAVKGQSSCVFAYGQTGSGKTYTTFGDLSNPDRYGIIPRAAARLLAGLEAKWGSGAREIAERLGIPSASSRPVLRMSILECYNEDLSDLLFPSGNPGGCGGSPSSELGTVRVVPFSHAMEIIQEDQAEAVKVAAAAAKAAEREVRRTGLPGGGGTRLASPEPQTSTPVNSTIFTPLSIGEHPSRGTVVSPSNSVEVSSSQAAPKTYRAEKSLRTSARAQTEKTHALTPPPHTLFVFSYLYPAD